MTADKDYHRAVRGAVALLFLIGLLAVAASPSGCKIKGQRLVCMSANNL